MDQRQARTDIEITCGQLEPDALAVLLEVSQRLLAGQATYGPLELDSDTRDFIYEAHEEDLDGLVYRTMSFIQRQRQLAAAQ